MSSPFPSNNLDDSFFNQCRMEHPPGILTVLANTVHQFLNPRLAGFVVMFFFIGYPLSFWVGENIFTHANYKRFVRTRLVVLHLLYRVTYTLSLVVVLYGIFRQQRPCSIQGVQIGSIYGMPSGDATLGGLVAMTIIMLMPVARKITWTVGGLVFVTKVFERVAMGVHSIGQVAAGSMLGILLHIYSTHVPIQHVVWETILQIIVGPIVLALDPSETFRDNDPNNMWTFYIYGMAFQIFVSVLIVRHIAKFHLDPLHSFGRSYSQLNSESVELTPFFKEPAAYSGATRSSINSVDGDLLEDGVPSFLTRNEYLRRLWVIGDFKFTFILGCLFVLLIIFAYSVQIWNPFGT